MLFTLSTQNYAYYLKILKCNVIDKPENYYFNIHLLPKVKIQNYEIDVLRKALKLINVNGQMWTLETSRGLLNLTYRI